MRLVRKRDRQHLFRACHFEVQRQVGGFLYPFEIVVADMPPVFAQVGGDPVAADRGYDLGRAHRVRMIAAACVADRGDVVDIDPEAQPFAHALRLPGLVTGMAASSSGSSSSA